MNRVSESVLIKPSVVADRCKFAYITTETAWYGVARSSCQAIPRAIKRSMESESQGKLRQRSFLRWTEALQPHWQRLSTWSPNFFPTDLLPPPKHGAPRFGSYEVWPTSVDTIASHRREVVGKHKKWMEVCVLVHVRYVWTHMNNSVPFTGRFQRVQMASAVRCAEFSLLWTLEITSPLLYTRYPELYLNIS